MSTATTAVVKHRPTPQEVPWDEMLDGPQQGPELDKWCAEHGRQCAVCYDLYFAEAEEGYGHGSFEVI